MTVCIAAICTWSRNNPLWIVGASDRMLSAPDIKFEPPQQKIYRFHQYAIALVAGDPYAQISICDETLRAHLAKPRQTIKELADLYADAFSAHRRQLAEAKYLKPLGLDANALIDRSSELQPDNVARLQLDLQREELDAAAIIAGIDQTGPHLFVVTDPGQVACADSVGFASIGSGKAHADSYFMLAHHTRNTLFHKALLDVYVAKKRSEVSPTVGSYTDIFYINPTGAPGGGFAPLGEDPSVQIELERIHKNLEAKIATAKRDAEFEADLFMTDYTNPKPAQPQPMQPPVASPPEPTVQPVAPLAVTDQPDTTPSSPPARRKRKPTTKPK